MRSAESLKRRAEYTKAWRLANPDYHKVKNKAKREADVELARQKSRDWRAEHPENVKVWRKNYAETHPSVSLPIIPIPVLHIGHELFDKARELIKAPAPMTLYQSQRELDSEDARSEAILAMLEGNDPKEAATKFLAKENGWRKITGPLLIEQENYA